MSERVESLLVELIAQQQKTNDLLGSLIQVQSQLIEALAEEGQDPDAQPARYLDGSKVR